MKELEEHGRRPVRGRGPDGRASQMKKHATWGHPDLPKGFGGESTNGKLKHRSIMGWFLTVSKREGRKGRIIRG